MYLFPSYFKKYTPHSCYWAGVIESLGEISISKDSVSFYASSKYTNHIREFMEEVDCTQRIIFSKYPVALKGMSPNTWMMFIKFTQKEWINDLRVNFDILPKNVNNAPPNLSHQDALYFIKGLLGGRGSILFKGAPDASRFSLELFIPTCSLEYADWVISHLDKFVSGLRLSKKLEKGKWVVFTRSYRRALYLFMKLRHLPTPRAEFKWDKYTDNEILSRLNIPRRQGRKWPVLVSPEGNVLQPINIRKFCRENNLDRRTIQKMVRGCRLSHKGWKLEKPVRRIKKCRN